MSVVTTHMVYFCAFARSEIFQKNTRKSGVGRGQFDAGVNGLIKYSDNIMIYHSITGEEEILTQLNILIIS